MAELPTPPEGEVAPPCVKPPRPAAPPAGVRERQAPPAGGVREKQAPPAGGVRYHPGAEQMEVDEVEEEGGDRAATKISKGIVTGMKFYPWVIWRYIVKLTRLF